MTKIRLCLCKLLNMKPIQDELSTGIPAGTGMGMDGDTQGYTCGTAQLQCSYIHTQYIQHVQQSVMNTIYAVYFVLSGMMNKCLELNEQLMKIICKYDGYGDILDSYQDDLRGLVMLIKLLKPLKMLKLQIIVYTIQYYLQMWNYPGEVFPDEVMRTNPPS